MKQRYNEIEFVDVVTGEVLSKLNWSGSMYQDSISVKKFRIHLELFLSKVVNSSDSLCIMFTSKEFEDNIVGNKQLEIF